MNRSINFMAIVLAVIGISGIVVWKIILPSNAPASAGISAPVPQKYDTTGGQEMSPRWKTGEGEGDEAEN